MNARTSFTLAGIALALLIYIMAFERSPEAGRASSETHPLFPMLDVRGTALLEIETTNGMVRAERSSDAWQVMAPPYPADAVQIENFLRAVADLKRTGYIAPKELLAQPGGLAPFGLNPAKAVVTVGTGTNRIKFLLGKKTPLKGEMYVQKIGEAGVFITNGEILDLLPKSRSDWRDRRLLIAAETFDHLDVQSASRSFEVEQDARTSAWRFTKPMAARADSRRLQDLFQQLQMARVIAFINDDPRSDLEPYGLAAPELRLTLARGTNRLAGVDFGHPATNNPELVYARLSNRTNVVLVSKDLLELLRNPYTVFRDRVLLTFSPEKVDRMEVRAEEQFTVERQTNSEWRIVEPYNFRVDSALVQSFLGNLAQLRIVDYVKDVVADFSSYGLAPPARQYILEHQTASPSGLTNEVIAQVDFSTHHADKVFARRPDETSVYAVSFGDIIYPRLVEQAFQLRDRRIFGFSSTNVVSISIFQKGQTRQLAREQTGGWGLGDVANAALEETLYRLGQLHAVDWVAKGENRFRLLGFPGVDYRINLDLMRNNQKETLTLHFGKAAPRNGSVYAAVIFPGEKEPTIFEFPGKLFAEVVRDLSLSSRAGAL